MLWLLKVTFFFNNNKKTWQDTARHQRGDTTTKYPNFFMSLEEKHQRLWNRKIKEKERWADCRCLEGPDGSPQFEMDDLCVIVKKTVCNLSGKRSRMWNIADISISDINMWWYIVNYKNLALQVFEVSHECPWAFLVPVEVSLCCECACLSAKFLMILGSGT